MSRPSRPASPQAAGLAFAAVSMVTYGLVPVLGHRFALAMDPLLFGGLATIAGSLPLFAALKPAGRREVWSARFSRPFALIALCNGAATAALFVGTRMTSGLHTGLLLQLEPFYSILLAVLLLGERVKLSEAAATSVMVAGAAVILHKPGASWNVGEVMVALAPLFHQLSHVVTKSRLLGRVSETAVIPAGRLLYSGLAVTAAAVLVRPAALPGMLTWSTLAMVLFFGLIFRGLDCWLWYEAIARIPLSRASSLIPLSVAVSFFGSLTILGERPDARQLAGLALIFASAAWLAKLGLKEPEPPGA